MNSIHDEMIQKHVLDELRTEPAINAAEIGVFVKDGVVTLTGHVPTHAEKVVAEEAALRIRGVRAVADDLDVRLSPTHIRTDEDIAAAAVNALRWHSSIPKDAIQVVVEDGWVLLEGTVNWHFQKKAAEEAVRHLIGVKSVTNSIKIRSRPHAKPTDVKHRIKEALKRRATLEASDIKVEVIGDEVKLDGNVHSWKELDAARTAAWSVDGVKNVDCKLQVVPQ